MLDNDMFPLHYWNWDNQLKHPPLANVIPAMYSNQELPLYHPVWNNSLAPPFVVDMDTARGCTKKTLEFLQFSKVESGEMEAWTFEDYSHRTVHAWIETPDAQAPLYPSDNIGNFGWSAFDPIFHPHHANMDCIWNI
uniref:Tyrosinase copper-binding domain-containing protein n=1 Tax=Physcomitrium patens TaxID=3218 RepID=A9T0R4_PHYPA|nr:polyphenol oxidase latent form, chloroplastic-like [Physcomitrium patens]PNR63355.1 hypothetical protein PHYPA_001780 [Physcomitrium patens]|eukprot:XP_024383156.1 polyphenol oxidase latent form, chloroplastic-like [Physcomitrella patens]